jgi:hypothetical protein
LETPFFSVDTDGFPTVAFDIKQYFRSDDDIEVRLAMTIVSVYKVWKYETEVFTNTIYDINRKVIESFEDQDVILVRKIVRDIFPSTDDV